MMRRLSLLTLAAMAVPVAWTDFGHSVAPAWEAPSARKDIRPPTADELRAIGNRVIANQHRDDYAADAFERIEHHMVRNSAAAPRPSEDKTYRVVPTGSGTIKLLIEDNGRPVAAEEYRRQLRTWEQILEVAIRADDPRQRASLEKSEKKRKERAELVDSALEAFHFTWLGREFRNGCPVSKLSLEPNPQFRPHTRAAEILTHARATIWVDEESGQLVHAETEIIRDISFGGGILGKVYRGGHFVMDQAEAAPGIWLPVRYQYDFSGRKFFFSFEIHEVTEVSHFRRLGTASEALAAVRRELRLNPASPAGDP